MMLYCLYYCTYDKITCSKLQAFADQVTMLPLRVLFGVTLALASPECEVGWGYEGRGEPSSPNLRWNSAPKMSPGMAKPLGFQFQEAVWSRIFHEFPLWQPVKRTCLSTPLDIVGWVSWSVPPFRGDSGWHPGWLQVTWQVPTSRVLKIAKRQSLNLIEKYLISL